ncbi:MAG: UbiA family prenyltransferase [Planctomycetota bacterium]
MLRALFQLIRLPNCFTAIPDVWAGWLIAGTFAALAADQFAIGLLVVGAVGFLSYAGGVAMNDLFDLRHDREQRPERPLPSGRLSLRAAVLITVLPLVVALGLVLWWRPSAWPAIVVLIVLIVLYNALHKRVPVVGLPLMAACRSANVVVGLSLGGHAWGTSHAAWIHPLVLGLWVLSISIVARLERRFGFAIRAVPRMILAIALIDAAAVAIVTGRADLALMVAVWIVPAAYLKRFFAMS